MYGVVPPEALAEAVPVADAKQSAPVVVTDADTWVGSVTVALLVIVQPFASVIVTVYVPAVKPVLFCVVAPPFHV